MKDLDSTKLTGITFWSSDNYMLSWEICSSKQAAESYLRDKGYSPKDSETWSHPDIDGEAYVYEGIEVIR